MSVTRMDYIVILFLLLGLTQIHSSPVQASSGDDAAAVDSADSANVSTVEAKNAPVPNPAQPVISAPSQRAGSLSRPDGVADYLASIRKSGLHMTVDSVNEGYKHKNRSSFEDSSIKIKSKNNQDFTRNGQVQSFEGPGFKLRTAILTENNNGKLKSSVVTSRDSEKNYTRSRDRLTQFVGTLDTDQFSSGALLNDHSKRIVSGSVRQEVDGNRDSRLRKQTSDDLISGSFLKTANLTINSRYQANAFSDRQKTVSDIILGDADSSSADGAVPVDSAAKAGTIASGMAAAGGATSSGDDQQDES